MSAPSKRTRRLSVAAILALAAIGLSGGGEHASRPVSGQAAPVARAAVPRPIGGVHAAPIVRRARVAAVADEPVIAPRGSVEDAVRAVIDAGGEVAWRAPRTGLLLARFATASDAHQARAVLAADDRVRAIYANRIMTGAGIVTSPGVVQTWLLRALGLQLASAARSAQGVTVALLDSGVAYESYSDALGTYALAPDLAGTSFAAGWAFVNNAAPPNDDYGHGTHLANLIAASASITPTGPSATILPIKVLDASNHGTELALAEGIRFAVDHGAHVI